MTVEEYERQVPTYDLSPKPAWYYALGLSGEAGEVAEYVKKAIRADVSVPRELIAEELGDVLWYLTRLAGVLGYDLGQIMALNIEKLEQRVAQGRITG